MYSKKYIRRCDKNYAIMSDSKMSKNLKNVRLFCLIIYLIRLTYSRTHCTLLRLILGGRSNCKFWEKNSQVHLIITRE